MSTVRSIFRLGGASRTEPEHPNHTPLIPASDLMQEGNSLLRRNSWWPSSTREQVRRQASTDNSVQSRQSTHDDASDRQPVVTQAAHATQRTPRHQAHASRQRARHSTPLLSNNSSPAIPDSLFFASDFMLGAGMVIIQPATANVVLIHEAAKNFWFLPKGRKDVGESLEQAVLREAHEESGYHASFLPVRMPTNAPSAPATPHARSLPCTEPFYVSTLHWRPQPHRADVGGEYFTFWYLGQIEADAVSPSRFRSHNRIHLAIAMLLRSAKTTQCSLFSLASSMRDFVWLPTVIRSRHESSISSKQNSCENSIRLRRTLFQGCYQSDVSCIIVVRFFPIYQSCTGH